MKIKELIKELKTLDQEKEIYLSSDEEGNGFSSLEGGKFFYSHTLQVTDKNNYILFPFQIMDENEI